MKVTSLRLTVLSIFLIICASIAYGDQDVCRAVALGGGGDRGSYEAGALAAFIDYHQGDYDVVTGISAGSINAVGYGQFPKGKEKEAKDFLLTNWKTIKRTDVYKNWIPGGIAEGFLLKSGLVDTSPLRQYLKDNINLTSLRNTDRDVILGATNIINSKYTTFNHTYANIVEAVMASSAIPGLFPPIQIGKDVYVDGGASYMTPVTDAIRICKTKYPSKKIAVDVILAFGDSDYPAALDIMTTPFILLRTGFLIVNNIFVKDIQNAKIAYPNVAVRVVKPTKWLGSIGLLFDKCPQMIQVGYEDATKIIHETSKF